MKKFLLLILFSMLIACGGPDPAKIQAQQKAAEMRKAQQAETQKRTLEAEKKIKSYTQAEKQKQKVSQLNNIKSICRNFGYKEGSEKFADCVKEIYLKETSQPTTQTVIVQQGDSGSKQLADELKRQRRQQGFDELLGVSKGLSEGKSLSEALGGTSGSSSKRTMTCFKTGEEVGGFNKSCRYSCAGNLVTTTVGSAQMCPIQIKR
jgi:type II secretory pathway component PulF